MDQASISLVHEADKGFLPCAAHKQHDDSDSRMTSSTRSKPQQSMDKI